MLLLVSGASGADFSKDIQPLLEANCISCHGAEKQASGVRLDSASGFQAAGAATVLEVVDSGAMPPAGPKLDATKLKAWIEAGAAWPAGLVLGAKVLGAKKKDDLALAEEIAKRIQPTGKFEPYKKTLPGTAISYEMRAIPGGEFSMGTAGRKDEEPVRRVRVQPFWMMAHEVTWDEYRLFMFSKQAGEVLGADGTIDAISRPTRPYVEMSFGMGITGFPAISMTQHAANKYAEWLSARTGEFYRLPTEAEWEYACKAGGSGEPSNLAEVAWYGDNSNGKYQKTGVKKANPFGLFDMLGNVMEWTLDQYGTYPPATGVVDSPWVQATKPYPHAVRGGSWNDPAENCRCGARVPSDASWKQQDPQLPKSIWYLTDAQWLGFRLVRPVKVPSAAEMYKYWNNGVEKEY